MSKYKRKYVDHEQFDEAVDQYIADCKVDEKKPTITGLVLALGFSSRGSLMRYEQNPEFRDSVRRARLLIENSYEEDLRQRGMSPVGSIFALKNLGDWKDKRDVELSGEDDFMEALFTKLAERKENREEKTASDG